MKDDKTYKGKPCRVSEIEIGDTLFTVISVQSETAKETLREKLKKQILTGIKEKTDQLD